MSGDSGHVLEELKISKEQLTNYREAFEYFDKDGNGNISTKELGMLLRSLGENPTEQELMDMINEVDIDDNQQVDFQEFARLMANKHQEQDIDEQVREAIRTFDRQGQGYIEADDFRMVVNSIEHALSPDEVERLMTALDSAGDGKIIYENFGDLLVEDIDV